MEQSKRPLWRKTMLQSLNLYDIKNFLSEIYENGDVFGYAREDESAYYQEYKEQFDDLADGAYRLWEALDRWDVSENWDDMTVALLGDTHTVLGYNDVECDYFGMLSRWDEERAVDEAVKRIERLTKRDMIRVFRSVMATLVLFFDIKAAHDCLTSIVSELDERAAMMQSGGAAPQRAWVE